MQAYFFYKRFACPPGCWQRCSWLSAETLPTPPRIVFNCPRPFPSKPFLLPGQKAHPHLSEVMYALQQLYNSLSDVYAILGPGQSWLPQVLCSPPSFFPDPKSWALPEWTVPICVRDEEFQCKHVLSSVILMGLSCYQKTVSKIMLCLNMAKMNQMVSNSPSLA